MQDKSKFDELLISYLSNELNQEDEAFVLEWINSDEQNRKYFEELNILWKLCGTKQAVDNINVNYEWKHFKQIIYDKQQEAYLLKEVESIADKVTKNERLKSKAVLYKIVVSTAIAALVMLMIGLSSGWFKNQKPPEQSLAGVTNEKSPSLKVFARHEKNTSSKQVHLKLQDGSEITLSDKSEVSFLEPFSGNRRDITLKGRAYFKVAKDKAKPFTVFSGDISTTALGTEFIVTAFESGKNIVVKLYQGKVVVNSSYTAKKKLKNEFYLLPGQEFIYDKVNMSGKVKIFRPISKVPSKDNSKAIENDNPSIPQLGSESWYMFNNQPLEQVFKQLEDLFNVEIVYSKKDISKIYFISTFRNSDSLDSILNQIGRLNNLKVTRKNDKFIITK